MPAIETAYVEGQNQNSSKVIKLTDKPKWNDYGESSLTLLAVHCRIDKEEPGIPYDPSDFRRCVHLFECLSLNKDEINNLLWKASGKYQIWEPFAKNWDELMKLYNEEKDQARAPKLYEAMQNVIKQ